MADLCPAGVLSAASAALPAAVPCCCDVVRVPRWNLISSCSAGWRPACRVWVGLREGFHACLFLDSRFMQYCQWIALSVLQVVGCACVLVCACALQLEALQTCRCTTERVQVGGVCCACCAVVGAAGHEHPTRPPPRLERASRVCQRRWWIVRDVGVLAYGPQGS